MENTSVNLINNKRAQMTIWAIVALLIMAGIVIIYLLVRPPVPISISGQDPRPIISSCVREAVYEAENIILPQGGFIEPNNFKNYLGQKVSYICRNNGYFEPCIQQHPMYLNDIADEIKKYISPKVDSCFDELKSNYEKNLYSVELEEMNLSVRLAPGKIYLDLFRPITIKKRDSSNSISDFSLSAPSPIFELASVASEISTQEAKYCYFEYLGYMILYPRYDIRKVTLSEGTRIYTLRDIQTSKELNVAIRGCVITPGI